MLIPEADWLAHYGILRKSGRYPWGSGDTQSERNQTFLDTVAGLRKQGMSETDIAKGFDMTTTQLRTLKTIAKAEQKQAQIGMARRLKDSGYSNVAAAQRMGIPEPTFRSLLAPTQKDRNDVLQNTTDMLKSQVAEKKYVDIGAGVEHHIGVSRTKLNAAVAALQEKGYKRYYVKVEQLGTGQQTTLKVLAPPGTPYSEVFRNRSDIKQISDFSQDGGRSFLGLQKPISVDSKRISIRYAEDGGAQADGVMYVRPGVSDLSLGSARYAQVRVAVGDSHYLKGMAMYIDDLPVGTDIVFNTNKSNTGNKLDALKKQKDDPDNPFGAVVRQLMDDNGKVRSAMNIVNEEGDWQNWSKTLSSQFLSKQKPSLARAQLDMTYERKLNDYQEIAKLSNPAVRKKLLESFASDVDSSAVHLKAAALPRQGSHVILPINTMKETEVYAPNFNNGERVALVRFPHGGTFEIPELTVNNRHPEAKKALGNAKDAIGIHSKVAERLSGADFDGDTVLVIPNNQGKVRSAPALEGLKGFDPQSYKIPDDSPIPKISARTKQVEMGVVSNLITDMTIRGANTSELARAVRHSMVVIDAEKHGLDYKQSAKDNGIAQLKAKYQADPNNPKRKGASTLISRAGSDVRVEERKARSASLGGAVDKTTGKRMFENTGASFVDRNGKLVIKTEKSKKLAETDDAHTLSSGTVMENIYADHSNKLKALANKARLDAVHTPNLKYSPSAKAAYSNEVESLNSKLTVALRNAPLERQAQVLANTVVRQKRQANPDMEASDVKKIKAQALNEMRLRTGAKKARIEITDSEWAAIQAGAITNNKLNQIMANADLDRVKELATPRDRVTMTATKISRANSMLASGYTQAEVAGALGVSVSTLKNSISE